jgi:GNAT superfamily N-acetyltransferase
MNPVKRLAELIEDWQYLAKRDGLKSAIPVVAVDIIQLPYRHLNFEIFARALNEPLPELMSKMPYLIRPFKRDDLKLIYQINRPSEAKLCAHRLAKGHWGVIAIDHVQAIGYAWACVEVDDLVERVPIKLESGDVLFNDAFTSPAHRGQGVQTALTIERLRLVKERGYKRAICYIDINNLPSIHVWKKKLNSSIIGSIDFTRFGAWYFSKFSEKVF